jgi:hypothetical protein
MMMNFDRFDICEAYYTFACDWHGGMNCPIYRVFGKLQRMQFRISPLHRGYESLSENGREIYDALCVKHNNINVA